TTSADPALLRSILSNLFENAVDYTPPGGALAISVESRSRAAVVRVINFAPDIDPADAGNLFERFWRKEAARSGGQHVGLGLALSRTFAHAMAWTLHAEVNEQRQLIITLRRDPCE